MCSSLNTIDYSMFNNFNEAFLYSWMWISLCHFLPGHKGNALPQSIYLSLFKLYLDFQYLCSRVKLFSRMDLNILSGFPDRAEEKDSVITKLHLIGDFTKRKCKLHFELSGTDFSLVHVSEWKVWLNVQKSERSFASLSWWVCCGDIQRHVSHIGEFRDGQSRILLITSLQYRLHMYFVVIKTIEIVADNFYAC